LNVGAALSFSEWDTTTVASRSTITGPAAGTGDRCAHAAARAAAAARLIEVSTASPPAARRSTVRDTVGSDATRPNTAGCARSTAMSARQSPPNASVPARSRTTLPGSWTAVSGHHGPRARDNPRSNPVARAVWTNNAPPADEARGSVPATIPGSGARPTRPRPLTRRWPFGLVFTYGVPLLAADIWTLSKPSFPARTGTSVHHRPIGPRVSPHPVKARG